MARPKPPGPNHIARTRVDAWSLQMSKRYYTTSDSWGWKTPCTRVASDVLPGLEGTESEDAKVLVVLLCFLAQSEIPLALLSRGASRRKRWDESGGIEQREAFGSGLFDELVRICSCNMTLNRALSQLQSSSAIPKISDDTFKLDQCVKAAILRRIPTEHHSAWRLQALIIACRSIPWKYLEHR